MGEVYFRRCCFTVRRSRQLFDWIVAIIFHIVMVGVGGWSEADRLVAGKNIRVFIIV